MERARGTAGLIAMGLILIASGCDKDRKDDVAPMAASPSGSAAGPSNDQREQIKVGDDIVVESGSATFWAGKVVKLEDSKVVYEYGSNRSTGEAERDRVYVVAEDHRTVAHTDDLAICKTDPTSWNPCVVKREQQGAFLIDDSFGKEQKLSASEVIVPNAESRARIKEKLDKAFKHRDFVHAARAAGLPRRPDGWTPRPGDEIVAQFTDSSWYGGRIRRLTPTKIHIAWDDKSTPSERNHDEVAPKPEAPQEVREGQYVLGRPRRGSRWDYYLVVSVDERGVVLLDKEGRKRKVKKSDVIALGT
jgi:hypothetical protein